MIPDRLHSILSELPQHVKLVAVSKFHPVSALREAYDAGQRVFGESRPQEFAAKVPQLPSDIEWHFIGHLQTNKLKLVLPYASLVESVDSFHLLEAISRWAVSAGRTVDVLLELHLGSEETKSGFSSEEILSICAIAAGGNIPSETYGHPRPYQREGPEGCDLRTEACLRPESADFGRDGAKRRVSEGIFPPVALKNICLRGLMGMATNTEDEEVIRGEFAKIAALKREINERFPELETFTELSIGMSDDWPLAIEAGSTMVRIGTAIFGPREY